MIEGGGGTGASQRALVCTVNTRYRSASIGHFVPPWCASLSVVGALRGPFFRVVTFSSVKGVSVLRILRGIRPANPLVGECLICRNIVVGVAS